MGKRSRGFFMFASGVTLLIACGGSARIDLSGSGGGSAGVKVCGLAKDSGPCDADQPSFWHNPKTGLCEPFIYGGCAGNANRFATRNECLAACPGGGNAWGACKKDSDCALVTLGCCQGCEPLADSDYLALNEQYVDEEFGSRSCTPIPACEPCPPTNETTDTGKYQKPVCISGQCSALDIRHSPLTECEVNDDCVLRVGVTCCQQCNGGFVSVNANSNFCPNGPEPCPKCAAVPPAGVAAGCVEKRCVELPLR